MSVSPSDFQTIETMDSPQMGISPGISYWEKKKVKPEKYLFPRKRFLEVLPACQTAIQDEAETQRAVGQWWGGTTP